ncbi:hypothetical protein F5B21DRAFT_502916 [Xylaria acuta]|nr:hypothetical protein F5B21DRAFT_502916 [Xylaria acuta]
MMSNVPKDEALENASNIMALIFQRSGPFISEEARVKVLQAANKVIRILEKPEDGLIKFAFTNDLDGYSCVPTIGYFRNDHEEWDCLNLDIANKGNADEILIIHISNRLAQGMIKFIYDASMLPIAQGVNWLKETVYRNPVDERHGMFQAANHTDLPTFKWLTVPKNKELWGNANTFFEGDRGSRSSWLSWFPVKDRLFPEGHQQKTLLPVDVAGGRGYDLMEFLTKYPDEQGPFVLQDQKPVLDSALLLSPKIPKQPFDLFEDSPVQCKHTGVVDSSGNRL